MSREVKRVPLDFEWPMSTVWEGFLIPERLRTKDCEACHGRGETDALLWVHQITSLLLLLDRSTQRLHPYFKDTGSYTDGRLPSADIAEFGEGLAGRKGGPMGHDAIDSWTATKKIVVAAGLDPEVWGMCEVCTGKGYAEVYEGQCADAEAWQPVQPPTGEGWQLWETVSEGSPISLVFDSAENLATWIFESEQAQSYESALKFVHAGWAPTMVLSSAGLQSGIDAVGAGL